MLLVGGVSFGPSLYPGFDTPFINIWCILASVSEFSKWCFTNFFELGSTFSMSWLPRITSQGNITCKFILNISICLKAISNVKRVAEPDCTICVIHIFKLLEIRSLKFNLKIRRETFSTVRCPELCTLVSF